MGAGEIVINNIDRDGTMIGYDLKLANLTEASQIPITFLGGAKSCEDMELIKETGTVGCSAGVFLFKRKV